jgi:hypothetical protein
MDDRPTSAMDELDPAFRGFAAACAFAVGIGGFAYAVAFMAVLRGSGEPAAAASAAFLLIGGLLATPVLVAVYLIVRPTSPGVALWALTIGLTGAIGSAIHGGFDLANVINEPSGSGGGFPNAVDPRGLLTSGSPRWERRPWLGSSCAAAGFHAGSVSSQPSLPRCSSWSTSAGSSYSTRSIRSSSSRRWRPASS